MNGRLEKEIDANKKMEKKLKKLPEIFSLFYSWMCAREKTYTTMNNYINHVIEFMEFVTKGKKDKDFYLKVTDDDIERYMISIRTTIKNGEEVTVGDDIRAAKWSSLNTFYKFLALKKHIEINPMLQTERPRVRNKHSVTYMTQEEVSSVFKRIEEEARSSLKSRDTAIVAMGLTTGLRVSAIVNTNVEDVDFRTNTIRVVEKGRKTKDVKFSNNFKSILLMWLKDREVLFGMDPSTGPLFVSQKKIRISDDSVEVLVKKYTSHLPKKITPHKLRSTAAMNLYASGVGILTIANILGHENVTTTQRYTEAYDEEKQNATNILDNLI